MSNAQTVAAVAVLALVGVVAWREVDKHVEAAKSTAAVGNASAGLSSAAPGGLLTGVLAPGSTATPTGQGVSLADWQRSQQEQSAALLKAQRVDTLRRDLADVFNEIDRQVLAANVIKGRAVDPAFSASISGREWASCRSSGPWLTQAQRCNDGNMGPRIDAAIKAEWAAKTADDLKPIQARLSELNAKQNALVENLRQLGYNVPAAQTKQVNV